MNPEIVFVDHFGRRAKLVRDAESKAIMLVMDDGAEHKRVLGVGKRILTDSPSCIMTIGSWIADAICTRHVFQIFPTEDGGTERKFTNMAIDVAMKFITGQGAKNEEDDGKDQGRQEVHLRHDPGCDLDPEGNRGEAR